ncbi:MAG: hypothetical protein AAF962_11290 [Actinomycetota bacterium]
MTAETSTRPAVRTWPTIAVLVGLWVATLLGHLWVFGVLLIIGAAWDIRAGESHVLQRISRRQTPRVFWAVVLSWIAFGLLWLLYPTTGSLAVGPVS